MQTQFQISKKQVKGSKIYKILCENKIIDTRISRNDYTSATVFFSVFDGYDVVYHSEKSMVGVFDPVQSRMKMPGCYLRGVALLK